MGWGGRREGGSGRGTHVNPWLIHVNVWQKPLQYYKVISLQIIKINGKKKRTACHSSSCVSCTSLGELGLLILFVHPLNLYLFSSSSLVLSSGSTMMNKVLHSLRDLALHETISTTTAYFDHFQTSVCKGNNLTFPISGGVLFLFGYKRHSCFSEVS